MFTDWFKDIMQRLESKCFLSFFLSLFLSASLSFCLSFCLRLFLNVWMSVFLFFSLSISYFKSKNFLFLFPTLKAITFYLTLSFSQNLLTLSSCFSLWNISCRFCLPACLFIRSVHLSFSAHPTTQQCWVANRCSTKWDFNFFYSLGFVFSCYLEGAQRTAPFTQ